MYSHDALWKSLIQVFFPDFLELVVPKIARRLYLEAPRFLEKEAFADVPKGRKALLDVLAEVPDRDGQDRLVLVHVELERDFGRDMDRRMARYFFHLCLKYEQPVVPIVLFLRGGPAGVTVRQVEHRAVDFVVNRFRYWALGLSGSEARALLARGALGVALAACARGDRLAKDEQKYLCMEALLAAQVDEARKELLMTAIETYLTLNEEQEMKYAARVTQSPHQTEMQEMELTWAGKLHEKGYRQGRREGAELGRREGAELGRREGIELGRREGVELGRQQGVQLGRQEGVELGRQEGVEIGRLEESRRMLRMILSRRFGTSTERLEHRLARIDDPVRLEEIAHRALGDASLDEIERLLEPSL